MPVLVGRDRELAGIEAALDGLTDPPAAPWILEVVGEPGIGKTSILRELRDGARARGHLELAGRAGEFERSVPFAMLLDALDGGPLADTLHGLIGQADVEAAERFRLHRTIRAQLAELSEPDGLVLLLDDVHWADTASIDLLAYLMRHPPGGRVLLALAFRPAQAPHTLTAALATAAQDGFVRRLHLNGLSEQDAKLLLDGQVDGGLRRAIYAQSNGNPFYLLELAKDPEHANLGAALRAELAGLPAEQRMVAHAAAVAGDPFDPALVARIAELAPARTWAALDHLLARDLLRAEDERRLRFRHPLVRQAVYTGSGAGWRISAHGRAAQALAGFGAPLAVRADHIAKAADPGDEDAVALLTEAAGTVESTAPASAAYWLRTAVTLLPAGQDRRRWGLSVRAARALGRTGELAAGLEIVTSLLRELPADEPLRAEAVAAGAAMWRLLGRHETATRALFAELATLADQDGAAAASLKLEIHSANLVAARFDADRDLVPEALATARRVGNRVLEATACGLIALSSHMTGHAADGLPWRDTAASIVDSLTDDALSERLDAIVWLAWSEVFFGRLTDAVRHADRGLRLVHSTGQHALLPYLQIVRADGLYWQGRLDDALQAADDAHETALLLGSDELCRSAGATLSWLFAVTGDVAAAVRTGQRAVAIASPVTGWWGPIAELYLAHAHWLAGTVDLAPEYARIVGAQGAPGIDDEDRLRFYDCLTRAEIDRGKVPAARAVAERAREFAVAGLDLRAGVAELAMARVLLAEGSPAEAADEAESAVRTLSAIGARFHLAQAMLVRAEAAAALGDPRRAETDRQYARALFAECGARGWLAATAVPLGWDRLTAREKEIAELVAQGASNRDVATKLVLSERTVGTHLSNVYGKLSLGSRTELAGWYTRNRG